MSIRGKIIISFVAVTSVIALFLSIFIYFFTKQYIEADFLQRMTARAEMAGKAKLEVDPNNAIFFKEIRDKHFEKLPGEQEFIFEKPQLDLVVDSIGISLPPDFISDLLSKGTAKFAEKDRYWLASLQDHEGTTYVILLNAWNEQGSELLANLKHNLITGFAATVLLVFFAGFLLSKELINPIREIIENTKRITASNLHLRLHQKNGKDEISALTQTFNDMLDRLETAFETQSNFVNKAAHELRTPLTAIIGEAELALNKKRSEDEYIEALSIIYKEAGQLENLTSSLLELAQAGYSSKEPFMCELRLDELLFSVKRVIDFNEPQNKVHINLDSLPESEGMLTIRGNANLLRLALSNIIQNSCKYSENNDVQVFLSFDEEYCIVTVKDRGIGIPEREIKYIFDPFFRASNTGSFRGYGVGLPLAQKILRVHRGHLQYHSIEGLGTTAKIYIPFIGDNIAD